MEHSVKINVESDEEGFGYVQVGIEFEQEEEKQMDEEVKHSEEDVNLYDASYFVGDRLIYDGKRVCSYILSLKNMSDVSKNKL